MHWECPELVAGIAHSCTVYVISRYKTSHVWLGEWVSAQYAIFKWEVVYTTSEYGISKSTDYQGIIFSTLYRTITSSAFDISSECLQFALVFVLVWNIEIRWFLLWSGSLGIVKLTPIMKFKSLIVLNSLG